MGVNIASILFLPLDIQRSHAVEIQDVLPAVSAQESLSLDATFQLVALIFLVPDRVLLDTQRLRELLEDRNEASVSSHNLLALNTTVVNLVLTGLALLEDTRNNALANNTLAQVVDHHCSGGEQSVDIKLVNGLDTENILAHSHTCGFVATLGGESSNAIGTEGVEDVVVDKYLGVPRLSGV